jgi:hypothetical protein
MTLGSEEGRAEPVGSRSGQMKVARNQTVTRGVAMVSLVLRPLR